MPDTGFSLEPTPPFDFDLTVGFQTYFGHGHGADVFKDGVFRRVMDLGNGPTLAAVRSEGTLESPRLDVRLSDNDLDAQSVGEARRQGSWMLGVSDDLAPFYQMADADAHLAPVVEIFRGLHPPHMPSVFEALVHAVLGQQINARFARTLGGRLIETYGEKVHVDGVKYGAFPRPGALVLAGVGGLREIKVSGRKAEYIMGIATEIATGELDLERLRSRPLEEAMEVLTGIRGVGRWTAQWLAIRAFGHPDSFPSDDLALQRHLGKLVNNGGPMGASEAEEYSRRWAPYRSYVTVYLFAAARSGRLDELTDAAG